MKQRKRTTAKQFVLPWFILEKFPKARLFGAYIADIDLIDLAVERKRGSIVIV